MTAPWNAAIAESLALVHDDARAGRWDDAVATLNRLAAERALRNASGLPVVFADALAAGDEPYEAHIARTGRVPTRRGDAGGWHDLLNALVWLAFPLTKARLNALQAGAIDAHGVGSERGALRDAATLFDENAAVVLTEDPCIERDLRARRWRTSFVEGRERFVAGARVLVFGHALLDKLRRPYKAACAHAWFVHAPPGSADVDAALVATLDQRALVPQAFSPLPVLGVPGWWPANADPDFYDDAAVFRPQRRRAGRAAPRHDLRRGTIGQGAGWTVAGDSSLEEGPDSAGQGAG